MVIIRRDAVGACIEVTRPTVISQIPSLDHLPADITFIKSMLCRLIGQEVKFGTL